MLFSEVYGSYFNVAAAVLGEAVSGELTDRRLLEIVREKAFAESVLSLPAALRGGDWPLLTGELDTPVRHVPTMPLTTLQKRWMKALLLDPRIRLFDPPREGLEDAPPLYTPDMFVWFDRYSDGDPWEDEGYISRFRTVLTALREGRKLWVRYRGGHGGERRCDCLPRRLEYSPKDDKFRLIAAVPRHPLTVNLARMEECRLLDPPAPGEYRPQRPVRRRLTLELIDRRNALERAMLHFSDLEKETRRLSEDRYQLTLRYDHSDETELLIRVLSFGPMLRVISPESFKALIRERLAMQRECGR